MKARYPIRLILLLWSPLAVASPADLPVPAEAMGRVLSPRIVVAPDRPDWTYAVGEPVVFSIEVLTDGHPVPGAVVEVAVGPEQFEAQPVRKILEKGYLRLEGGTLQEPGFLRCIVTAEIGGLLYKGLATAAFDPLDIKPTQEEPPDFDAFWKAQLASLEDIPLDLHKTLVPEACTADVNVYHINYRTMGLRGYSLFYGMLAEPKEPGKYPAILQVPGAGIRPYLANTELAAKGAIVLSVGIHGLPVDLDPAVYEHLHQGALLNYQTFNLDSRDRYYYRRVYLGCVRGNDVLTSHPMWDGRTLVVAGGSQGGQLSIVTAALDNRVTGLVSNYPAYCDVTGYLNGRAGGWPHMFRGGEHRISEKIDTSSYYDVVNFARRLRVPGSFAWGYNDETCPPTSMFAAYNAITSPKELFLQLEMGHRGSGEFYTKFSDRVRSMAGLTEQLASSR